MLVLSRQRNETIMIGDDIEITIVDIRGDKVRLGINAPREIQVHRKEVYDGIKRENQQASKLNPRDVSEPQGGLAAGETGLPGAKKGARPKGSRPDSHAADRESRSASNAETIAAKDKQPGEPGTPSDPDRSKSTGGDK